MVTDIIGDLIIRIKNANLAKKESISLYTSKNKEAVAEALKRAGFIKSVSKNKSGKMLEITLDYKADGSAKVSGVQRISKPSRRVYSGVSEIKLFKNGFGATFLSTPAGILSDKEAIKQKVGGELMFRVW